MEYTYRIHPSPLWHMITSTSPGEQPQSSRILAATVARSGGRANSAKMRLFSLLGCHRGRYSQIFCLIDFCSVQSFQSIELYRKPREKRNTIKQNGLKILRPACRATRFGTMLPRPLDTGLRLWTWNVTQCLPCPLPACLGANASWSPRFSGPNSCPYIVPVDMERRRCPPLDKNTMKEHTFQTPRLHPSSFLKATTATMKDHHFTWTCRTCCILLSLYVSQNEWSQG